MNNSIMKYSIIFFACMGVAQTMQPRAYSQWLTVPLGIEYNIMNVGIGTNAFTIPSPDPMSGSYPQELLHLHFINSLEETPPPPRILLSMYDPVICTTGEQYFHTHIGYKMNSAISDIASMRDFVIAMSNPTAPGQPCDTEPQDLIVANRTVDGRIRFSTAPSAGVETERMTILSNGNVGMGTNTPVAPLHVSDHFFNNSINDDGLFLLGVEGFNRMAMDANEIQAKKNDNGVDVPHDLHLQRFGGRVLIHRSLQESQRVVIDAIGQLGIGTDEPSTHLHVSSHSFNSAIADDGLLLLGVEGYDRLAMDANEIQAKKDDNGVDVPHDLHLQRFGGDLLIHRDLPEAQRVVVDEIGRVGIGITSPQENLHVKGAAIVTNNVTIGTNSYTGTANTETLRLTVDGAIVGKECIITLNDWADFVFEDGYPLMSLTDLERSINEYGRLPGIPSTDEVRSNGIEVGRMQAKLLQKVEELTLYVIEQHKRLGAQEIALESLQRKNDELTHTLKHLQK